MDYVEFFYTNNVGRYPFTTEKEADITKGTIEYLKDCGFTHREILLTIIDYDRGSYMHPEFLPETLWENSLIRKGHFYYHHALRLVSKPPTFDPSTGTEKVPDFYLEMKIRFTMEDLIAYFYNTLGIDLSLKDIKRDAGSFKFLLQKYEKLDFIESLDFVLSLIDFAKHANDEILSILDIARNEAEVYKKLKCHTAEAKHSRADMVTWRSGKCKDS